MSTIEKQKISLPVNGELQRLGEVVAVNDNALQVAVTRENSCGGCAEKKQCGVNALQDQSRHKKLLIDIPVNEENRIPMVDAGDQVEIGVEGKSLVTAALFLYLLPTIFIIIGTFLGMSFANMLSLPADLFALLGAGVAVIVAARIQTTHQESVAQHFHIRSFIAKYQGTQSEK